MYNVKVIADSISLYNTRITTLQLTYPRYIHAEVMTHRSFSRNASSSRAIPTAKLIENSVRDMVYPIAWGKNQAGMQASLEELSDEDKATAKMIWEDMAYYCANGVKRLSELGGINPVTGKPVGLHKQWANRPLEWFGNITTLVTATDWDNWFELRDHPDAQPEIQHLAKLMREAMDSSIVLRLDTGMWHLPYTTPEEILDNTTSVLLKMSTARCARVSYLTQEGTIPSVEKDLQLYDRLVGSVPLHASPCEHQALVGLSGDIRSGNLRGWIQHRKILEQNA